MPSSNATESDQSVSRAVLEQWMKSTLAVATKGTSSGQFPFGASVYRTNGALIVASHNTVAASKDVSEHAEVNAIRSACRLVERSVLADAWLISTAEPCPMCFATAALAGIRKIVFGAPQSVVDEAGFKSLGVSATELSPRFRPEITLVGSVLLPECNALLMNYQRDRTNR